MRTINGIRFDFTSPHKSKKKKKRKKMHLMDAKNHADGNEGWGGALPKMVSFVEDRNCLNVSIFGVNKILYRVV